MRLRIDPALSDIAPGTIPSDWATRASFSHPLAAVFWLRAIEEPSSLESDDDIVSMYAAMVEDLRGDWRYFISMGAGSGIADRRIIRRISTPALEYVPIDLSSSMCRLACASLESVCHVPFGIVSDFEAAFPHVRTGIEPLTGGKKFVCSTSTVGNLDLGEARFLRSMSSILEPGDHLLFSVGAGAFEWPLSRATFDVRVGWHDLSGLLACGISMITGESVEQIESGLEDRIDVRTGRSDIPRAGAVELWDRKSGRTLLHLRRYDLSAMQAWIRDWLGLRIVRIEATGPPSADVRMAALLLTRH